MPDIDVLRRDLEIHDVLLRWPWAGWGIHGVEVTQAVQYYDSERHLTDAADRQPDNSVTLIAGKPAWVRVYVRAVGSRATFPASPEHSPFAAASSVSCGRTSARCRGGTRRGLNRVPPLGGARTP